MLRKFHVDITATVGTGPWSADTEHFSGRILDIVWDGVIADGHDDVTGDPDIDVEVVETGEKLWDEDDVAAAKTHRPASAVHTNDGAASTQLDFYNLVSERLRFTVAGVTVASAPVVGRFTVRYFDPPQDAGAGVPSVVG
jgi:hypothetical protein